MQPVFSFKCRGAYNMMANLSAAALARGVIASSAGNHAQGVALAAQKLGCAAVIVMPSTTPQNKVDAGKAPRGGGDLHRGNHKQTPPRLPPPGPLPLRPFFWGGGRGAGHRGRGHA